MKYRLKDIDDESCLLIPRWPMVEADNEYIHRDRHNDLRRVSLCLESEEDSVQQLRASHFRL